MIVFYACILNVFACVPLFGRCEDVAEKLKTTLKRPNCTASNFVNPDVQCPKKPRGRKKQAPKTNEPNNADGKPADSFRRPSAAACGFSTVDMTDAEIEQALEQALHTNNDKGRRKRSVKAKDATAAANVETNNEGSKRRKTTKTADSEPVEPKAKKPRTRKAKESKEIAADKPSVTASAVAKGKSSQPSKLTSTAANTDNSAPEDAKQQAKALASRKSSAYHKAKREAKKNGKTDEEAKLAGKEVS